MHQFVESEVVLFIVSEAFIFIVLIAFVVYLILRNVRKYNKDHMEKQFLIINSKNARIKEGVRIMNEISREVHDNISQSVSTLKMQLHVIKKNEQDLQQIDRLNEAIDIASKILKDTQNISRSINSDYLMAVGLHIVIEQFLDQVAKNFELEYHFEVVGEILKIHPDSKILVLRIAQEAIHNITKHACATKISVCLNYDVPTFTMYIGDNGLGIPQGKHHNGIGLINMRERAALLDGELFIDSVCGDGCTIKLHVPHMRFAE